MELETREFTTTLTLGESEDRSGPGVITGLLLPYETEARDRKEMFTKNAARWEGTVPLNRMHVRKEIVTRAELSQSDEGVRLTAKLPDTARARDLAVEVRAGIHRGLSVEFKSIKEKSVQGVRIIMDAVIGGAAVVSDGAYPTTVEARDKDKNGPLLDYLGDGCY